MHCVCSSLFYFHRPSQNGPEVIGLLAKIFEDFSKPSQIDFKDTAESTVVMIALEALKALCEAEVCFNCARVSNVS